MGRPAKPILSRPTIAQAALEVIDADGVPALTMRALAERFGTSAAALYNHIASKEDLLGAVSELIDRDIDLGPLQWPDWQAGIAVYARAYRAVYRRHPNFIASVARAPLTSAAALAGYDALLATLRRAGCPLALATATAAALDYLVLGSALETFAMGFDRPAEQYRPAYPHVADALAGAADGGEAAIIDDSGFELGMKMLLGGVARQLDLVAND